MQMVPNIDGVRHALDSVRGLPIIRALRKVRHERAFAKATWNCFNGVFATCEEALAAIPEGRPPSYDNADSGALYEERLDHVYEHDYPVLFWMRPLVESARRVFDLGGHVGIARYGYDGYIGPLGDVEWQVCDVPAVVEAGRKLARARNQKGLTFTSRYDDVNGADIAYASGSLQYIMSPRLPALLGRVDAPPSHVILSMMPTTSLRTFYTLNNIGTAICPYIVVNEDEFIGEMNASGYTLIDAWTNPQKQLTLPLQPDHSVDGYRGFYFRRGA